MLITSRVWLIYWVWEWFNVSTNTVQIIRATTGHKPGNDNASCYAIQITASQFVDKPRDASACVMCQQQLGYQWQSYCMTLMGSYRQAIEWYQFRWPWVTPDLDFRVAVFFEVRYLKTVQDGAIVTIFSVNRSRTRSIFYHVLPVTSSVMCRWCAVPRLGDSRWSCLIYRWYTVSTCV